MCGGHPHEGLSRATFSHQEQRLLAAQGFGGSGDDDRLGEVRLTKQRLDDRVVGILRGVVERIEVCLGLLAENRPVSQ